MSIQDERQARRRALAALALAALALTLGAEAAEGTGRSSRTPVAPTCPSLPAGAENLVEPGAITLVGEVHGTVEAPAFFASLVCAAVLAAAAPGVIVGIEMPRSDQAAVDAFFAAESIAEARARLLAADHFTDRWRDGRDSESMVALLEDLRRWRASGAALTVVAFDVPAAVGMAAAARERAMAERLAIAVERHPGATVLVYTGNVHSRTVPGVPWDAELAPMGSLLRASFQRLRSLDFASAGGSTWACMTSAADEPTCGEHPQAGRDRGAHPFVELWSEPDAVGHDGIYYLGRISASPPAVADRREGAAADD